MREGKKYYPMLAGFEENDFFREDNIVMWEKKHTLPKHIQNILMSDEIVDFIYAVERRYNLHDDQTEAFSQLVRQYYFGEITDNDFVQKISSMCHTLPQDVMALLRAMNAITPKNGNEEIQREKMRTEKLSLVDALAKYPRIKEQEISGKMIVSKPFLQALKPTVKNWIMVYEKVLGVSRHDAIERGDFVFRAEATRNLSDDERNLLADILRARDDQSLVMVDMDAQKIIIMQTVNDAIKTRDIKPNGNITVKQTTERFEYPEKRMQVEQKNHITEGKQIQESFINKQKDPRKNPVFDELQKEIMKNRAEMTGGAVQVQSVQKESVPVGVAKPGTFVNVVQQNVKEEITAQNTSAIAGTIQFSSNHVMPGEKVVQKKLQATQNYYNMSPIGGVHSASVQKNAQKTS